MKEFDYRGWTIRPDLHHRWYAESPSHKTYLHASSIEDLKSVIDHDCATETGTIEPNEEKADAS